MNVPCICVYGDIDLYQEFIIEREGVPTKLMSMKITASVIAVKACIHINTCPHV